MPRLKRHVRVKRSGQERRKGNETILPQDLLRDQTLFEPNERYFRTTKKSGFIPHKSDHIQVASQIAGHWDKNKRTLIGKYKPTGQSIFADTRFGERRGTRKKIKKSK